MLGIIIISIKYSAITLSLIIIGILFLMFGFLRIYCTKTNNIDDNTNRMIELNNNEFNNEVNNQLIKNNDLQNWRVVPVNFPEGIPIGIPIKAPDSFFIAVPVM